MKKRDLIFSFDVGHSSIGWNVLQETADGPNELALGTVIFTADGCLTSKRRVFRRQRRTIRSRRQRIEDIEKLFVHQGLLTHEQLEAKHKQAGGDSAPWLLASAILVGNGEFTLSAEELFDVIRWYAHNRGYDGNRRWAGNADTDDDTAKEEAAIDLMEKFSTSTMAETISAQLGLQPNGHKRASLKKYKDSGAAFPRKVVVAEVEKILRTHIGKLSGCDDVFVETLCGENDDVWKSIPIDGIKKPKTFKGGLLFGQKIPRFDNRILSFCPITDKPTPLKAATEFMEFRCAMFLANVRVKDTGAGEMRSLNKKELNAIWDLVSERGYLTAGDFKKTVRKLGDFEQDNLEALMIIEDTATNLVVDPALKRIHSSKVLKEIWSTLPEPIAKEFLFQLGKKRAITLAQVQEFMKGTVPKAFSEAVEVAYKKPDQKKYPTLERWMERKTYRAEFDKGRAPYGRDVMKKVVAEVLEGTDSREKGGCLYITDEIREKVNHRKLDELTNNHLVRHRLLILNRLFDDMVDEFADGEKERVKTVVVEVNREVSAMSGKTAKQIKKEEGLKRADHKKARKKLEDAIKAEGRDIPITAGLIRKARIAQDLNWTCPFTGLEYEPIHLVEKQVDLDHIIPRSERLSDSMAGLVVTFSEVNRMKGKRTAWQFIQDEQGNPVKGKPSLSIMPMKAYEHFVDKLKTFGGVGSDEARRKNRKQFLLMPDYKDKAFTPRDLTISSYVTKLALQQIKNKFDECRLKPQVVALPGRMTGETRKSWKLMGLLHAVNEKIDGKTLKDDIRSMTHLHHAVDAAVMGLLAYYIRDLSDGATWQLLLKRNLTATEKSILHSNIKNIGFDKNRAHLLGVPKTVQEQIRKRLAERRVVQHVPSSMEGLHTEENTRGVVGFASKTGKVVLRQKKDGSDNITNEVAGKLLGYDTDADSKLKKQKGVRVIDQNFGVALTKPLPQIITWHKVYPKLKALQETTGEWPCVLRNGMVVHVSDGRYEGAWRIFSLKNNASGMAVDMGFPDEVKASKINVLLKTPIKDGMKLVCTKLTGDGICRITSSISTARQSD